MGRKRHLRRDTPKDASQERHDAALKALKDFQKTPNDLSSLGDLLSEESDRGAVILVGSLIEDLLADRIIEKLPNGERHRDALLRIGGVLSTFHDKLTMGQVLGVITDDAADSLDILRSMRNACSHSRHEISLRTPQLLEVFSLLLDSDADDNIKQASPELTRVVFNFVAMYYFELLTGSTPEEAQTTFNRLWTRFKFLVTEEAAKRKASLEKRRARSKMARPQQDQKAPRP